MPSSTSPFPDLHISVGSYDATVVGLHLSTDGDGLLALEARFAYAAHAGSVRALTHLGDTLASASSDETVRVYDVARRAEVAALVHHAGSVNALALARDPLSAAPLLFSAADDAALCVTRAADWRLLKRLPAHTAPVVALAVHPSVRVALTLARDRSIFLWNLERGRVAFSAKIKPVPATAVHWSPDGARYLLACETRAALYTADGRLEGTFEHKAPLRAAAFVDNRRIVTGGEDRVVRIWDARNTTRPVATPAAHESRVRGVAAVRTAIVSADSGGGVKVWDERRGGPPRLETEVGGGGMRLTCLSVASACGEDAQAGIPEPSKKASKRARPTAANETVASDAGNDAGPSCDLGDMPMPATGTKPKAVVDVPPRAKRPKALSGLKQNGQGVGSAPKLAAAPKEGTASSRKRRNRKETMRK